MKFLQTWYLTNKKKIAKENMARLDNKQINKYLNIYVHEAVNHQMHPRRPSS